ncbi:hypothetical protein CANINC_000770 [Pichia inconspicua]|uniref:Uncharacterized protein n=1 Tax=Pichia inconspicua TaxID=52247 RepID=A0A4T0X5L8_9ASCO|nr:hypothetical protein CANINC_000770 [[Candida] inconspicua]
MGILWRKSNSEKEVSVDDETVPLSEDLSRFLEGKESQLSNREFKELIRRQSENAASAKEDKSGTAPDFLQLLQAKKPEEAGSSIGEVGVDKSELPPTPLSTAIGMRTPHEYVNYELESYRRNNDEKESVLTNCSEIQNAFYECLGKQSIWDRVRSVSQLESDDCTKLADFFMACTEVQKKAFLMFDYSTLNNIEEMKYASKTIDSVFSNSFKSVDDVQDRDKFLQYTKELRRQREEFYNKFGK